MWTVWDDWNVQNLDIFSYSPDTAVSDNSTSMMSMAHCDAETGEGAAPVPGEGGSSPQSDTHPAAAPEQTIFSPY